MNVLSADATKECGVDGGEMFRRSDQQGRLFQVANLLSDEKRQRLERDWPGQFHAHVLSLIDEDQFRDLYCADNGRPNKPVRTGSGRAGAQGNV